MSGHTVDTPEYKHRKLPHGRNLYDALIDTNLVPSNMWRDTVFVPPNGYATIKQRFGESVAWTGKTVYHCHFLDHEDQGMISAVEISNPKSPSQSHNLRGT